MKINNTALVQDTFLQRYYSFHTWVYCLHENGTWVVGTQCGHQVPALVWHYQGAGLAGVASAGTLAWRLGMMVVVGGTGTLGTSLLHNMWSMMY